MTSAADTVFARYGDLPSMSRHHAKRMEALIREQRPREVLELGFQHGKSSAVIAATLRDIGRGHLTTIDREEARAHTPNIDAVLADLGLTEWVTVHYAPRSYTWRLMKALESHSSPVFDFAYIDGGHMWDPTGFAFFLVDRLLRAGGMIVFDDLDWTLASMEPRFIGAAPGWFLRHPPEERGVAQVRKVWELLVKRHPGYGEFREEGQWGLARKVAPTAP